MLSRTSKRLLLESQWPISLPPSFLLPIQTRAWLTTIAQRTGQDDIPGSVISLDHRQILREGAVPSLPAIGTRTSTQHSTVPDASPPLSTSSHRKAPEEPKPHTTSLRLSENLRLMLPLLRAQQPHYITVHIHSKSYLVTTGDTIRLPFLMPDVSPGDILRLDRATIIGSRDYTLKSSLSPSLSGVHRNGAPINNNEDDISMNDTRRARLDAKRRKRMGYLDDRLFVCRATVTGVEGEPMRVIEKKKPRHRHNRHVYSKHRYTCLRISEITVKSLVELGQEHQAGTDNAESETAEVVVESQAEL